MYSATITWNSQVIPHETRRLELEFHRKVVSASRVVPQLGVLSQDIQGETRIREEFLRTRLEFAKLTFGLADCKRRRQDSHELDGPVLNVSGKNTSSEQVLSMQIRKVTSGQMWRNLDSGEVYVVTSLYRDVLASFALLRPVNNDGTAVNKRAKILKTGTGEEISGFTVADLVQYY